MKHLELHRFKKTIGAITFGLFFPNENKRLNKFHGKDKEEDLLLTFVPEGKQTVTVSYLRDITGWTVKKATAFVKQGDYPKVVIYNLRAVIGSDAETISDIIINAKDDNGVIFEIK